ncbi:MAG: zinc ribbon domain-containing protein [Lachnospiraceae bacterium]|nr:zinc ribbon domain-containing protein [Lachnospiraceae bacterium]
MYCTECGKEIRMNAKFCARCGARTDNPDNNATYPRQLFYANPAPAVRWKFTM